MSQLLNLQELNDWYTENEIDLSWLNKPSRHQFRWRNFYGRWSQNKRRISKYSVLQKSFGRIPPTDLYYGTSEWLEPMGLPRLRETKKPAPILLDHLVVFDIDKTPFCRRRLESARKVADSLLNWLEKNENLELKYVAYSGSKGFHIVLKDLDREKFSLPDPRKREQFVKDERKKLLQRVLDAGFDVDKTVTADTRRIIRLPSSLHGKTGWVCTIIDRETLAKPLRKWIKDIPRHEKSVKMKYWPSRIKPKKSTISEIKPVVEDRGFWITLEASSHVSGTKDRSVLLAWTPQHWGEKRKKRFYHQLDYFQLEPCYRWRSNNRDLILVPLALQKNHIMRRLKQLGLISLYSQYQRLGHSWTEISPRKWENGDIDDEFEYLGVIESGKNETDKLWSNPHLELVQRLGGIVQMNEPQNEKFVGPEFCNTRISKFK